MKISIPGGKFIHLGAGKMGQISDQASERPSIQKLVKAGEIEILGEGDQSQAGGAKGGPTHAATHGHPQPKVVLPKGNR